MRSVFSVGVCLSAIALAIVITFNDRVSTQNAEGARAQIGEGGLVATAAATATTLATISDALTGFGLGSNGFAEEFCGNQANLAHSPNSPKIPDNECSFDSAVEEFSAHEENDEGIGPVYNATGCGECH